MKIPLLALLFCTSTLATQTPTPANTFTAEIESPARLAASEKYARALLVLDGKDGKKDDPEALRSLTESAEAGLPEAANRLGYLLEHGLGMKADLVAARSWYEKAATGGSDRGQANFARLLIEGKGGPADKVRGLEFLNKAAAQKLVPAQLALGQIYYFGEYEQPRDYKTAFLLFLAAAEAGNMIAQNFVGTMYKHGEGIKLNDKEAANWYLKAASQGDPKAQAALGDALLTGTGIKRNQVEAMKYFMLSSEQGEETGTRQMEALTINMDPNLIAQATERAEEFRSKLEKKKTAGEKETQPSSPKVETATLKP